MITPQQQLGNPNAGGQDRRHFADDATKPREGMMTGNKDDLSDKELEGIWERYQAEHGARADADREMMRQGADHARYNAVLQQKIKLKGNGQEVDFGAARAVLAILRVMQANNPDQFAELVRSVRPSGATQRPQISFQLVIGRKGLADRGIIGPNGFDIDPLFAAVLDAAYTETKEGVILRDPVIPPSKEFVEELIAAEKEVDRKVILAARKDRGKGEGTGR